MRYLSVGLPPAIPGLRIFVLVSSRDNTQRAFPPTGYSTWYYCGSSSGCYVEIFETFVTVIPPLSVAFQLLNDSVTTIDAFCKPSLE